MLLDSNVIFQAEDPNPVPALIGELYTVLNKSGVEVFVHEASRDDILRDKDEERRANSLSKFSKYPMLQKPIVQPARLSAEFGPSRNENDESDAHLLFALKQDVARSSGDARCRVVQACRASGARVAGSIASASYRLPE